MTRPKLTRANRTGADALQRPALQSSQVGKITGKAVMAASKIPARVTTVIADNMISHLRVAGTPPLISFPSGRWGDLKSFGPGDDGGRFADRRRGYAMSYRRQGRWFCGTEIRSDSNNPSQSSEQTAW